MALEAHTRYMTNLKEAGIDVEVFDQPVEAPDSIFPDWFITARNSIFPGKRNINLRWCTDSFRYENRGAAERVNP